MNFIVIDTGFTDTSKITVSIKNKGVKDTDASFMQLIKEFTDMTSKQDTINHFQKALN